VPAGSLLLFKAGALPDYQNHRADQGGCRGTAHQLAQRRVDEGEIDGPAFAAGCCSPAGYRVVYRG